ncbi:MAG: twin-arginine translocase TatA/TatE family subunit [Acidobacteria bacterium]|nr:twin-arginine translocase TatA/TatE family subunit [Acidobacteriota bacterium]
MFGGKLGLPELLLILAIVLIIFGGRKIPEIMKGFGEGIRSFKEGMHGGEKPEDKPAETKK